MASIPRLMPGQGAIIATGAIDYPAEYQGAAPETRAMLGISKVMTITCTYDHRIIQGAESGTFLGKLQALLDGDDGFYDEIFADLQHAAPAGALGARPRSRCCPAWRRARCRDRQGGRRHPAHQRLPRARPPDRRPRPARRRAQLPPRARSAPPTASPSGTSTASFSPAPSAKRCGEGGAQARRHAARDSRNAAPDLLRQDRLRVHEHPGPGAEALAAAAHGAAGQQLAARPRDARLRILRRPDRGRGVRALPARALRRPEALRARRRRSGHRHPGRIARARRGARTSTRWSSAWRTAAGSTCSPT